MDQRKGLFLWMTVLSMGVVSQADLSTMMLNIINPMRRDTEQVMLVKGTPDMIRAEGYPVEEHKITTEDGYILTLHRIPGNDTAKPVFLQHGLLGSSADWIIPGKDKALAYILHDQGYDVWLGNARGNTYSRCHKSLPSTDKKFWDFSYNEMGVYDLPAAFSHIRTIKHDSITYIGHSMGTTMFYVMASELPEVSKVVNVMFSLAPIAYVSHMKSPIKWIANWANNLQWILENIGDGEFLPQSKFLKFLAEIGCDLDKEQEKICANSLFLICGFDAQQFNYTLLPIILDNTPSGTSSKTLTHFGQQIISKKFRQYDYGEVKNKEKYGSPNPPEYNLSKINVPVGLFYADNDWLASTVDVDELASKLPKLIEKYKVQYEKFNHLDFIFGIDAPTLLYNRLLATLALRSRQYID